MVQSPKKSISYLCHQVKTDLKKSKRVEIDVNPQTFEKQRQALLRFTPAQR